MVARGQRHRVRDQPLQARLERRNVTNHAKADAVLVQFGNFLLQ